MTKTIIDTDTTDPVTLGANNSVLTITATGSVGRVQTNGPMQMINVTGTDCTVSVDGNVIDHTFGTSVTSAIYSTADDLTVTIGKSGFLGADIGVQFTGAHASVTNAGRIDGPETGIFANGSDFKVVNSGIITGLEGVSLEGTGKLVNEAGGRIIGYNGYGVQDESTASIVNHGYISGEINLWGGAHLTSDGTIADLIVIVSSGCQVDLRGGDYEAGGGSIIGGFGDDTLITDNAHYALSEQANGGVDTIKSSVSYKLPENIEFLTLIGKKDINGTGSDGAESIDGNSGDNVLKGGGGADNIAGLGGNDKLWGQDGIDTFYFGAGDGHDTIMDFDPTNEHVVLGDFKHVTTDEQAHKLFETHGSDTWVDFGGGDVLVFHGLSKAALADVVFQFVG